MKDSRTSKLILITGDIAAGKSTFSKLLSNRYNVEVYNKDNVKELLADSIGFSNREENLKLSRAAVQIMTLVFEKNSEIGKDLILEANFHKDEMDRLYQIARNMNVEILTIVFEADMEILYKRFRQRVEYENRHPAHQTAGLNTVEAFEKYIQTARDELDLTDYIKVNANDFSYQNDEALLKKIDLFMEK